MFIFEDTKLLREILREVRTIRAILTGEIRSVTDFTLIQTGGNMGAITGVPAGNSKHFTIGFVPATNFIPLQSGPTVAVDDTSVTLMPDASDPLAFTASVAATDTGASFNLTVTGVNDKGTTITHVFNVPILPAQTSITDFTLSQDN